MDLGIFRTFGEALALGLLIGSERYKGRSEEEPQPAGIRTFTIISLLGAACALMDVTWFTLAGFGSLVIFIGLAYYKDSSEGYGLTTEMAALLTFWLGYLLRDYEVLAISTGIIVVILLAAKKTLHGFVREQVTEVEFFDTLKFLAVVFVVFPLLPNRYIGPLEFLNPTQVWMLVILISFIGYAGYILIRIYGGRKGLMISAALGGVVSTLATTLSLAERAREAPKLSRLCGVTGVMANAVQFPRLLILVWVVDSGLGTRLLTPFLSMAIVGFLGAWLLSKTLGKRQVTRPVAPMLQNPFSLKPVMKFGLFFLAVLFVAKITGVWFGNQGVYITSILAGLGSVSAVAMSVTDLAGGGVISAEVAASAILLALISNALMKWLLSYMQGTRELAFWLGGGFVVMLGAGAVLIYSGIGL